jgi:hypothetical protein
MRTAFELKLAMIEQSDRMSAKDIALLLAGAVISLYVTVVFERYKRFGEMMRALARNREMSVRYPPCSTATVNLEIAYRRMEGFREFLAETTWNLEAEGHGAAAKEVAKLLSFMENAARCVDRMLQESTGNLTTEQYREQFNAEYQKVFNGNFQSLEDRLRPSWGALLRCYPHPKLAEKRVTTEFDTFHDLLDLRSPSPKLRV